MKWPLSWLMTVVVWVFVVSCAPKAAQVVTEVKQKETIQAIRVEPTSQKTEVFVKGEKAMTYTTFHLIEPDRLVVDILEVGLGSFTEKIAVPEGPIRQISPRSTEEGRVSRLEMELAEGVQTDVQQEGTTLKIIASVSTEFAEKSVPTSPIVAAVTEAQIEAPPQLPPAPTGNPAQTITDIRFDRSGMQLVVSGDGQFNPQAFYIDSSRLVIDLPAVQLAYKVEVIPVNDRTVKQVRVGAHSDKVRLVLDLLAPVLYSMQQSGSELLVSLKEGTPEKMTQEGAASVAPKEAQPPPPPPTEPPHAPQPPRQPKPQAQSQQKTPPPALPIVVDPLEAFEPSRRESVVSSSKYTGRKISLDFQDADISDIIRLIADVSRFNIVLSDDVKGKMTLKLVDVPWDQALDVILRMNILGQHKDGDIIVISTLASITQRQEEEARAKETGIKAEDQTTRVIYLNYSTASALSEPLKKLLSPRGDITPDPRTNTLIVRDIEGNIGEILRMAKVLDTRTPQVSIEARIVQVLPKFNRSLGIQWGASYKDVSDGNLIHLNNPLAGTLFGVSNPGFAVNVPASNTLGGFGFNFGRFTDSPLTLDLRLSAGESQGLTKIVSTPKVTVLDNQTANIEQGESIPFATTSNQGTQTTFVDANITLNVTPHISSDGGIVMKIRVAKNAPGETRPGASGPSILKKEAITNVLVLDGETIVIGGIQESTEVETTSGIPFLHKIPILGWFFGSKEKRKEDSELLVFLTPRLVKYER
jgi:type IV pilus assembly protein PilQ